MDGRISAWLIADRGAESGALETLPETTGLCVLEPRELASRKPSFAATEKLSITSEAAIETVLPRLDPDRQRAIGTLKDKTAFRRALRPMFPELYFKEVPIETLARLKLDPARRYAIKPAKGCFGSGVRIVDGDVDLEPLRTEIAEELARNGAILSESVLSKDALIVEEYIPGEEYAVDMFYDASGKAIITNIYHHPMPGNPAYLHMVYYSSRDVVERIFEPAMDFFGRLNEILQVRNLPIHSEFRWDRGRLVPIELNSLRFGGMGLANLGHVSLGINAYRCLIEDRGPDLPELWRGRGDGCFVFFIAYNGAGVDVSTHRPDWEALRARFTGVLREVPFDYQRQLAFGIVYAEEPADRLPKLLATEFDELFVPTASSTT